MELLRNFNLKWCDYMNGHSGFLRLLPLPNGNICKTSDTYIDQKALTREKTKYGFFPAVHALENGIGSEIDINDKSRSLYNFSNDETGWDRLIMMYTKNKYGEISPELQQVIQGALFAFSFGFFGGGLISARNASTDFFRQNQHTAYSTEYDARRKLTDAMSMALLKGGARGAAKLGFFSGSYMLLTTTVATYNNKATVFEHIATGALCGGLWRIHFGLKGLVAGGLLGSVLGLFAGSMIVTVMWLTGNSVAEMRYWQHEQYKKKIKKKQERSESKRQDDDRVNHLLVLHDDIYKNTLKINVSDELKETLLDEQKNN